MKSSARIDSAVFQLTPTRTRCDLVILANGRTEKIASGLINPFLAHLKAARDQMAVGGYSIELKPEPGSGTTWFTKGTLERFVRFVSTPEILERVDTLESEISQIEEAIALQSNKNGSVSCVEEHHGKSVENAEAAKSVLNTDEDKAIVLYEPNYHSVESTVQEGNSKVDLLKVLETRRNVLQKEQGMAFACAVAAGFEIDNMDTLISFAQCFGAARMMDACKRFIDLWKKKHMSGQWLEIEAAEALSSQPDLMAMNASGIVLADPSNQQMSTSENNGEKSPIDHQVPAGQQEQFQGQYPNPVFPPWQFQSPPGVPPGYQPYPVAPIPYYPNYPANGPYFQPLFSPVPDQRSKSVNKSRHKRSSCNGKESTSESEASGKDSDVNDSDESDLEKETKMRRRKRGISGKKKSGMVVIRNVNYISSKEENGSDGEANSASGPGREDAEVRTGTLGRNGNLLYQIDSSYENEVDGGHWEAFQNFLLKDSEEDRTANKGMFSMEKDAKIKRHPKGAINDPLAVGGGDDGPHEEDYLDIQRMSGSVTWRQRASADEMMISRKGDRQSSRGSLDAHPNGVDDKRSAYRRTESDDFMVQGRDGISSLSPSELSSENRYKSAPRGSNLRSSYNATDDVYIVSSRSNSYEAKGTLLDIHSEFPSGGRQTDRVTKKAQPNYEPDYTSLMPERETERGSSSYDPAIDYEVHDQRPKGSTPSKNEKALAAKDQSCTKEAKDQKMKLSRDAARTTGPIRRGKPTKLSPLDEARARAERMRSYKADLQKVKKEKEEEQLKRLEALKIERQKRIAARSNSVPGPSSSQLVRKNIPNKLSPSPKPSKFTDAGQSSSSPLQRSSKRTVQAGTGQAVIQTAGTRLSLPSVPSLPKELKDSSSVKPDAKASMARIRRLSEPKMANSGVAHLVKPQRTDAAWQRMPRVGDSKQISAIISLDESKAASLPELKIRASKPSDAKSASTVSGNKRGNPRSSGTRITHLEDAYDSSVVEKTVLMLEPEKPQAPSSSAFQEKDHLPKKHRDGDISTGKQDPLLTNVNQSSSNGPGVEKSDTIKVPEQICDHQVKTYNLECSPSSATARPTEKPYQAPYARNSSLEEPCTKNSEYCKAVPAFRGITMEGPEAVKVHVFDSHGLGKKKPQETDEKQQQESLSKGFRKLWKFGRKSTDSASSEHIGELDNLLVCESDADNQTSTTGPSNEAYTLKNLICQDETPTASTTPKKSSHTFSLLSPFRSKSGEKKNAA